MGFRTSSTQSIRQLTEKELAPRVPDGCENKLLKDLSFWATYFKHGVFLKLEDGPSGYDTPPHTTE